jgi:hypothetical protein
VRIVLDVELDGDAISGRSLAGDGGHDTFHGWAQLASLIVDCCARGGATPTNHSEEAGHVEGA